MSQEKKKSIVKFVKSAGSVNANKIAQGALNLKKGTGTSKNLIDEMVSEGLLIEDSSGRYTEYSVPTKAKKKATSVGKAKKSSSKPKKKNAARKIAQPKAKKKKVESALKTKSLGGTVLVGMVLYWIAGYVL